jgi:hypothetical protein
MLIMRAEVTPIENSRMLGPRFRPRQAESRNLDAIALVSALPSQTDG